MRSCQYKKQSCQKTSNKNKKAMQYAHMISHKQQLSKDKQKSATLQNKNKILKTQYIIEKDNKSSHSKRTQSYKQKIDRMKRQNQQNNAKFDHGKKNQLLWIKHNRSKTQNFNLPFMDKSIIDDLFDEENNEIMRPKNKEKCGGDNRVKARINTDLIVGQSKQIKHKTINENRLKSTGSSSSSHLKKSATLNLKGINYTSNIPNYSLKNTHKYIPLNFIQTRQSSKTSQNQRHKVSSNQNSRNKKKQKSTNNPQHVLRKQTNNNLIDQACGLKQLKSKFKRQKSNQNNQKSNQYDCYLNQRIKNSDKHFTQQENHRQNNKNDLFQLSISNLSNILHNFDKQQQNVNIHRNQINNYQNKNQKKDKNINKISNKQKTKSKKIIQKSKQKSKNSTTNLLNLSKIKKQINCQRNTVASKRKQILTNLQQKVSYITSTIVDEFLDKESLKEHNQQAKPNTYKLNYQLEKQHNRCKDFNSQPNQITFQDIQRRDQKHYKLGKSNFSTGVDSLGMDHQIKQLLKLKLRAQMQISSQISKDLNQLKNMQNQNLYHIPKTYRIMDTSQISQQRSIKTYRQLVNNENSQKNILIDLLLKYQSMSDSILPFIYKNIQKSQLQDCQQSSDRNSKANLKINQEKMLQKYHDLMQKNVKYQKIINSLIQNGIDVQKYIKKQKIFYRDA